MSALKIKELKLPLMWLHENIDYLKNIKLSEGKVIVHVIFCDDERPTSEYFTSIHMVNIRGEVEPMAARFYCFHLNSSRMYSLGVEFNIRGVMQEKFLSQCVDFQMNRLVGFGYQIRLRNINRPIFFTI